ncbi:cytochrome C oxidase subunit IV [Micromonospora inaquosa]|uniref:Cytochrome c oxidase polypeptide 4 n=1 Tax=Micromonospora inaquosa TaxID=2203716 RepID=A0A3N9WSS5_9ACTN|nr:cytochrome C oxidase subunit IV [Micromonospora inaquosa]
MVRTESRIFSLVAVVFALFGAVYIAWTTQVYGHPEWAGATALLLSCALCAMCGLYFGFVARRIAPRPEDRADAEVADGAGEVGFFSPGSYWPFGLAAACAVAGLGLALWQAWLMGVGAVAVILAAAGLLFEYYTGTRRTAEH